MIIFRPQKTTKNDPFFEVQKAIKINKVNNKIIKNYKSLKN